MQKMIKNLVKNAIFIPIFDILFINMKMDCYMYHKCNIKVSLKTHFAYH